MKRLSIVALSLAFIMSRPAICKELSVYTMVFPADLSYLSAQPQEEPDQEAKEPGGDSNEQGWLEFFHAKNTLRKSKSLSDWNLQEIKDTASLNGLGLTNEVLPVGIFGVSEINNLSMHSNKLSSIDFLHGVREIGNLNLNNNESLVDIDGLRDVSFAGEIHLHKTGISNINSLSGLKAINVLDLSANKITDITPLSGISSALNAPYAKVILPKNPASYNKMHWSTTFCKEIVKGNVGVFITTDDGDPVWGGLNSRTSAGKICSSDNEWLEYFHSINKYLNDLNVGAIVSSGFPPYIQMDTYPVSKTNADLPSAPFPFKVIGSFSARYTLFSDFDFLNGIELAENIYVDGVSNLKSISFLRNLKTIGKLNISDTGVTSFDGLQGLTKAKEITFTFKTPEKTPSSIDIGALSGISSEGTIINLPNSTYKNKPPITSSFCTGVKNEEIRVYRVVSEHLYQKLKSSDVCEP